MRFKNSTFKDQFFMSKYSKILLEMKVKKERMTIIIHSLREKFKLKGLIKKLNFPKLTYMYWQKRFYRKNKEEYLQERIKSICKII
ncbi:hypothetical protein HMPREF9129_1584 [Peptoniphilus indolicus ATCC 29427]|uniref:Transposase n=1 Tax=Peptoniphilus indolicus ATCC 29427 TaxID=997350 RepID=G4D5A4_9FIRM|nr:hypothetical protein HMPREF9129_1584 [Peptoniphilus indolicus ATCC 29427]